MQRIVNPLPQVDFAKMRRELEGWPARLKRYQMPDRKRAIWQIVTTFVPFFALWTLMYLSLSWSIWITVALAFVQAFFMVKIFIIQHDCGHYSYLSSRRAQDIIGFICSLFSTVPYKYWAKSHDYHHAHNGQLDQRDVGDIKTYTVRQFKKLSPLKKLRYRVFRMPPVLFGLGSFFYLVVHNRIPIVRLSSFKRHEIGLLLNNIVIIALHVLMAWVLGWQKFLAVFLISFFLFGVVSVWLFYVQHQHETTYKNYKGKWEYLLAAVRGSSWYDLPAVLHWLTGNIGYHHIHHLNPKIPSYNLRRCSIENPVFNKWATRVNILDSLKTMRHKLWDESQQRMISFREYRRLYK